MKIFSLTSLLRLRCVAVSRNKWQISLSLPLHKPSTKSMGQTALSGWFTVLDLIHDFIFRRFHLCQGRTDLPTGICSSISRMSNAFHEFKKKKKMNIIWVSHNKIPKLHLGITGLNFKLAFLFLFVFVCFLLWLLLASYIPASFLLQFSTEF